MGEGVGNDGGRAVTDETTRTSVVIAPYLDSRGFVPRAYVVRGDGYPIAKVDGARGARDT